MELPTLPVQAPEWVFVVLVVVVLAAPVAAKRVRLPGILGLIVAGMLVGPNVLGLVDRSGFVETLGGAGLLFLMFMAGLELNLRAALGPGRNDTVIFGAMTFTAPMVVGTLALLLWGFEPLAAILIASCWASHTLVSYPIFQRLRIVQHRAVATGVGATMVTNVAALLVLAVVVAIEAGGSGPGSWAVLLGGLLLLAGLTLWALPRLTRWFFAGLGGDRLSQVLYVLAVMFAASALASLVRIEPIVGAFFAGLGINEHVPKNGVLGERLTFLGDVLLIPIFLVSVGMLIDPMSVFQGTTIVLLALTFTVQSLGGKFLAAVGFGRLRGYDRDEVGVLFSLTGAEAAATLAAIFVGFQVGLFGQGVVDAVVIVIMATCLFSTLLAERFGPRLRRPRPVRSLGGNIIVPVANPATAGPLTELAAAIVAADSGTVTPLSVLGRHVGRADLDEQQSVLLESESAALRMAVEAQSRVRIDDSTTDGILHEVVEQRGTGILMGWKGYASRREHLFGGVIDHLREAVDVPVLLCRPGSDDRVRRILLAPPAPGASSGPAGDLAADVATRIAMHLRTPVVAVAQGAPAGVELGEAAEDRMVIDMVRTDDRTADTFVEMSESGDLLVIPAGHLDNQLEEIARRLPDRTLLVVTA